MTKLVIKFIRRRDRVISLRYPGGREVVSAIEEIEHPIIRQALALRGFKGGLDLVIASESGQPSDQVYLENELSRLIAGA